MNEVEELAKTKQMAAKGEQITGVGPKPVPIPVAQKPAPAKTPKTPKTTLINQAIGAKDGNQELVEKKNGGSVQLWKNHKGSFGVVRIVNNRYQVVVSCRAVEASARETYVSTN